MSNFPFPFIFFDEQAYYQGEEAGFYDEDGLEEEGEENESDEDDEEEEEEDDDEDDDDEEDEEYVPPSGTAARVSSNRFSSTTATTTAASSSRIVESGAIETNSIPENVVEIIDDDDDEESGGGSGRRGGGGGGGGGGEASCSSSQGIEKEGKTRGETNGNDTDGVCCSICMEPWSSEGVHQISCLPCGHLYGLSCIEKWLRQSRYSKCPQCGRKCTVKNIIRLYVSRLAVTNGEQEKKLLSLQAENEFLKMKIANLHEKIQQDKESTSFGGMRSRSSEFISGTGFSQSQMQSGRSFRLNPVRQGSLLCSFVLEDELVVDGARIFDIDASNEILIIARRLSGMGGTHVLTKLSLMYPYESENVPLPPCTKAVKDLHIAPSGRLTLFASLGKKLSILSTESNNIVLTYELPSPAWSCSWDVNCPHHLYAGLQNGTIMAFDMRQTAGPLESMNGLTCHPVHSLHSLSQNSPVSNGVRPLLSASSIGPCVWNTGSAGERPFLVPDLDNQGVCISLAYSPLTEDIVASFRPKIQIPNDITGTQSSLSPSPSPTALGQGVLGSHILTKRVGGSCYQKLGSTSANVNDIRMTKSAIINIQNCNPLFAYGDEVTRGLSLQELPSLRVVQNLNQNQHPILDVRYGGSSSTGVLGCVSKDKLQLFSVKQH